jgi:hypothetical protein
MGEQKTINIKELACLTNIERGYHLDSSGSGCGLVAGYCEHDVERSGAINIGSFLSNFVTINFTLCSIKSVSPSLLVIATSEVDPVYIITSVGVKGS